MAYATRHYRLRIRDQANTADLLVLSSVEGGTNPYLTEAPEGDGQGVDQITGQIEIGAYTWRAWDNKESATEYTITKVLADALARNQILSNRCFGEYSVNGGVAWLSLHSGYLNNHRLITAGEFEFEVGDTDRREQDTEVFRYVDRAAGNFTKVSCIIGGPVPGGFGFGSGLQLDYGPVRFKVIADPSGLVTDNRVTLQLVSGYLRPYFLELKTTFEVGEKETINRLARQWFEYDAVTFATTSAQDSQPWGWFPGLIVEMDQVASSNLYYVNPIAKEAQKRSKLIVPISPDGPVGEYDALVNGSAPRMIVRWDDTVFGVGLTPPQPAVNTEFDVLVYPKEISEDAPLHISGHPADIRATLMTENGIPYDTTSLTNLKANASVGPDIRIELRITGPSKLAAFAEEYLDGPWGIGVRIKSDGVREFYPMRGTPPAVVDTVTIDDLVTADGREPGDVIFDVDENTTINGVDYEFLSWRRWLNAVYDTVTVRGKSVTVKVAGDDIHDQTIDLLTTGKFTIQGRRTATAVYGERVHVYKIPGQLLFFNSGLNAWTPVGVTNYALAAGDVIIDRAGWGVIVGEVEVDPSVVGLPGDYIDLDVPHQVNAKTAQTPKAQRGGIRKVQIVKRTNGLASSTLTLWDVGNVSQVAPTPGGTNTDPTPVGIIVPTFTLAAQSVAPITGGVADPLHYLTATVTNAAAIGAQGGEVHFEYKVQTAAPAASDVGLPMGYLPLPEVDNTVDSPEIRPSGQTVWVKARTRITATGQTSVWSAWQSLLLGPAQNGAGGDVAAPSLSFLIDSAGLVDVLAAVAGNVTSVKFAAAAVGAAEATDAAVRAATADSVAPFEALNIFTLGPSESRAVSAFAYDQFGNESAKATIVITRTLGVPAPSLTYSIDGAGLVDMLANVGTGVTSVKFAAAAVGAAEATDAAVRAATADSTAPFEALDIFTLAVGEQRAVSAFAYNAAGDESPKTTVMVVRSSTTARKSGFAVVIGTGTAVITTGEKPGYFRVPFTGKIVGWDLLVKPSGSLVVDSWKDAYSNHPPTVADTIWGGSKPTVSSATKAQATGLNIAVTEGEIIRHNVDSVTTCQEGTLNYHLERGA